MPDNAEFSSHRTTATIRKLIGSSFSVNHVEGLEWKIKLHSRVNLAPSF